jgi:23S rRNA pseudouridine1911/1915/1917 synthase
MAELYVLHRLTVREGGELFAVLARDIPGLSKSQARMAIAGGLVSVDGQVVNVAKQALTSGAQVQCDLRHGIQAAYHARKHGAPAPQEKPFTILHQDSYLIVVDKIAGINSAPPPKVPGDKPPRGHVPDLLRRTLRKRDAEPKFIGLVHRLDKETSGCLCFAFTREAQRLLAIQFSSHSAGREYRCITMRAPRQDSDTIRGAMTRDDDGRRILVREEDDGKEAITHFKVLRRFTSADGKDLGAELAVTLETGRTHQIRVSLAAIGCPVYGDPIYAHRAKHGKDEKIPVAPRMMLHAHRLSFDHPQAGERMTVEAPIPTTFGDFTKQLR